VKAVLLDLRGNLCAVCQAEYPLHHIRPAWVEQDPDDWWRATCQAIREALGKVPHGAERVLGLAVSSQAPTLLPLDASGRPLRPAMIWMDRRAKRNRRGSPNCWARRRSTASPATGLTSFMWAAPASGCGSRTRRSEEDREVRPGQRVYQLPADGTDRHGPGARRALADARLRHRRVVPGAMLRLRRGTVAIPGGSGSAPGSGEVTAEAAKLPAYAWALR